MSTLNIGGKGGRGREWWEKKGMKEKRKTERCNMEVGICKSEAKFFPSTVVLLLVFTTGLREGGCKKHTKVDTMLRSASL